MFEFYKSVRKEAGKIVFPTKDELKRDSAVTIAFCAASAVFLWGISEIVIKLLSLIVG